MSKPLLIVESPTKATTLRKILGSRYDVKASVGHVLDLPRNELGVDVRGGFTPRYKVIRGKEKVLKELETAAKKADTIYLASDPDREGEAIAWHIAERIGRKDSVYRVLFHELTKRGIAQAMKSVGSLDRNKYESQVARRVLDRLVGYQISPILWRKVRGGLSAGRVQSVALRIIVDREREIHAFVPEEFWSIVALLHAKTPPKMEARLVRFKGKAIKVRSKEEADEVLENLRGADFVVTDVSKKNQYRRPAPPFTTSTLQQEAVRKLRFTAKKTNMLAQRLYEGVVVGTEGQVGLITYMRTDSTRVAPEAQEEARAFIESTYGKSFVPGKPPVYKSGRHTQEAHEAIRPTDPGRSPEELKPHLEPDLFKLYELIWKRFIASQMKPAQLELTSIDITARDYLFRVTGTVVRFPGFMKLYTEGTDETSSNGEERRLPPVERGETLKLEKLVPTQHFTKPPPRFNEATLVKELEEQGIGRPSTYATILSNIQEREYVEKQKGQFYPTELGFFVNDLLVANFPDVMDVRFTAQMEEKLDQVEEGRVRWVELLESFYGPFEKKLETARKEMKAEFPSGVTCEKCGRPMLIKIGKAGSFLGCSGFPECRNTKDFTRDEKGNIVVAETKTTEVDEKCPNCGSPMVVKKGRFGAFIACTAYPKCKTTKPLRENEKPKTAPVEETDQVCELCGGKMVIKTSRAGGRFLACSNYPRCKNAKPLGLGIPCPRPGCTGELAERRSKKGVFYGCTRYPECRFATWNKPVAEQCPECGSPILLEKNTKKLGPHLACPRKECGYTRPLSEE